MDALPFSYNWNNKLNNACFSTIRLHNPRKYYVGNVLQPDLNKKALNPVSVVSVRPFMLSELTEEMARLDTSFSREECIDIIKNMYSKTAIDLTVMPLDFVILKKVKTDAETQKLNL